MFLSHHFLQSSSFLLRGFLRRLSHFVIVLFFLLFSRLSPYIPYFLSLDTLQVSSFLPRLPSLPFSGIKISTLSLPSFSYYCSPLFRFPSLSLSSLFFSLIFSLSLALLFHSLFHLTLCYSLSSSLPPHSSLRNHRSKRIQAPHSSVQYSTHRAIFKQTRNKRTASLRRERKKKEKEKGALCQVPDLQPDTHTRTHSQPDTYKGQ